MPTTDPTVRPPDQPEPPPATQPTSSSAPAPGPPAPPTSAPPADDPSSPTTSPSPSRSPKPALTGSPTEQAGSGATGSGGGGSGHGASRHADVVLGVPLPALRETARRIGDAALHIAQEPQYPLGVAALVGVFLLVQDLIDRRDPKLAGARVTSRDERLLFPDIFPPGGSS